MAQSGTNTGSGSPTKSENISRLRPAANFSSVRPVTKNDMTLLSKSAKIKLHLYANHLRSSGKDPRSRMMRLFVLALIEATYGNTSGISSKIDGQGPG